MNHDGPDFGSARPDESETVYAPNPRKQWRLIGLCAVAVLICLATSLPKLIGWMERGSAVDGTSLLAALGGLFAFVGALFCAVNLIRGLPRLTVAALGLTLETVGGSVWATWGSLGAFSIIARGGNRSGRPILSATAAVTGSEASRSVLRARKFIIPDAFLTPVGAIVADVNARRAAALGAPSSAPSIAEDPAEAEARIGVAGFTAPWFTFALLAALVVIFLIELGWALDRTGEAGHLDVPSLVALGGLNRMLVIAKGEWYRLFTAPLLHLGVVHLVSNGIALLLVGFSLERLVGRVWFFAVFVLGALGGALMSMAINAETITSVGASGAIMALFAALLVCSFRLPTGGRRTRMQARAFQVLIPSLIPVATSASAGHIDYGAHIGGALSGAVIAYLLLKTWPDAARLPQFRGAAAAIIVLGLSVTGASAIQAAWHYPTYRTLFSLIPQSELPRTQDQMVRRGKDLVARYPQDPRAHFYAGVSLTSAKDYVGAERELRQGLQQAQDLGFFLGSRLETLIRATLAGVLDDEGRKSDAKEMARALCQPQPSDSYTDKMREVLAEAHLCD